MKQIEKVQIIQNVQQHLTALIVELSQPDLTAEITPEGRIMSDIAAAVNPLDKRIKHALRLAKSHQ